MRALAIAALFAAAQGQVPTPPPQASEQTSTFKVSVDLVQVDAVVTDSKGRHVPDLKATDFEVLQDGKPQKITHFSYVETRVPGAQPAMQTVPGPAPVRPLRPNEVRRTIALIVDDLRMSFQSTVWVRDALKKYVERQVQPGDLVAILRTGAGIGALQQFTNNRRQLQAAVERIRWNALGRSERFGNDPDPLEDFRQEVYSVGTLGAIRYVIDGLKDLPGRKSVVVFSDGLRIFQKDENGFLQSDRIRNQLQVLTDAANRASVSIYTVDARGLESLAPDASQRTIAAPDTRVLQAQEDHFESRNGLNYLAQETGGMFLRDTNDIGQAIGQVLEDQAGYYLLGYTPTADTFAVDKAGRPRFHKISVRLKRPGLRLRSRNGFAGVPDKEQAPKPSTPGAQLWTAMASPFGASGVRLRLTSLFVNNDKAKPLIDTLLFMDAHDMTFARQPDGSHTTVIDVVVATFGDNGVPVDTSGGKFTIRVQDAEFERVLKAGLVYTLQHPVKRPGAYQMRVAVRDDASARVGAASQFIEVPDVKKDRLVLSSIILAGGSPSGAAGTAGTASRNDNAEPESSPAVRQFHPGRVFTYAVEVLNARKNGGKPDVETQLRLFSNGRQIYAGTPAPVHPSAAPLAGRLFATGTMKLSSRFAAGDYVLEVVATDKQAPTKRRTASQWIDFEVR